MYRNVKSNLNLFTKEYKLKINTLQIYDLLHLSCFGLSINHNGLKLKNKIEKFKYCGSI